MQKSRRNVLRYCSLAGLGALAGCLRVSNGDSTQTSTQSNTGDSTQTSAQSNTGDSTQTSSSDSLEGPVLQYRFEGDLTDAAGEYDLSGSGVTYVNGPEGSQASSWGGYASTEFEAIGSDESLTFCYWMRDSDTQSTWDDDLIWRISSKDGDGVGAFCDTSGEPFLFTSGSNTLDESETSVLDDEWHHIAFVYQQGRNRMRLYVDGVEEYDIEYTDNLSGMNSTLLMFGNVSEGSWKQYDGDLDDFRLYRRALGPAEIEQIAGR